MLSPPNSHFVCWNKQCFYKFNAYKWFTSILAKHLGKYVKNVLENSNKTNQNLILEVMAEFHCSESNIRYYTGDQIL